jgi:hypothetical protein
VAKYKVRGPDGEIHVFEGPDGASEEQVVAFARQHFGAPRTEPAQMRREIEDPGVLGTLGIGAGRTVDQVLDGLTQWLLQARGEESSLKALKQTNADKSEAYKPLQELRPIATAVGEALPAAVIPVGGTASLGTTAAKLAAAGAVPGALEYGTAGERAKRAAIGGAAAVTGGVVVPKVAQTVAKAVPAVGRAVRAATEPLTEGGRKAIAGRTLVNASGDDAGAVAQRLLQAQEIIPGSVPTAAQVADNGGIAALERAVSAANPAPFTQRGMEQASARVGALRNIAGDETARAGAVAARESATKGLYSQAKGATYTMDDQLERLLQTPAMQQAMTRAKSLAENNQRTFAFEVPGHDVMKGLGNRAPNSSTQITGQGLQDLKMAVDAMLKDPAAGFAGAEGQALKSLRGQLLNWMESRNPVFRQARTTYADMSKPIGQMDVGTELLTRLEPALNDYGGLARETGAKYAQALRNADQTAVKATKFKGTGMQDLMTPDQMDVIEGVARDLARKANAQDLGRGVGSDTFQKLALSNIAERSGAPGVVGTALDMPGVSKVAKFLYREPEEKIQTLIAQSLLEPKSAAKLMEEAIKRGKPQPVGDFLFSNPGRVTQVIGGAGGLATGELFTR